MMKSKTCPYCTFDENGDAKKDIRDAPGESTYLAADYKVLGIRLKFEITNLLKRN